MAVPIRTSPLSPDLLTPKDRATGTQVPVQNPVTASVMKPGQTATPNTPPVATGVQRPAGAYNPYTKGFETVTPGVWVNQGQYSPEAKQALWEKSGNSGQANMDAFFRKEDGTMGIKPEHVKNVNPNALSDADTMNAYLNGTANAAYINGGGNAKDTELSSVIESLSGLKGQSPGSFSRAQTYEDLRAKHGVTNLEAQLADLETQYNDELAMKRDRVNTERNRLQSKGALAGAISEVERQESERLDSLNRQRNTIATQLQAKNSVIENSVKLMGEDYAAASSKFDADFSKNLQIVNLARGIRSETMSEREKLQDNARATLQTVYNAVLGGGLDPNTLPDSQKIMMGKLEIQSGLPAGFIQNLYSKNPKSDVVMTNKIVETDGNEYASVMLRDMTTGAFSTQKILIGKSADYAKKQEELKIKQQQADTASVRAAKYKGGGSGGTKAKTDKTALALKGKVDTLVWNLRVKMSKGEMEQSEAHNEVYQRYGKDMTDLGYTDDQVKQILHNALK